MNNLKIIGSLLLGPGIGAVVFKALEDLNTGWAWIVSIFIIGGIVLFVQGSQEEAKKEILEELNNTKK